ncbi:MAG: HEAT repeat domain-containing protein, partial [Ignavibacteria bacterium]|nr:HEAT repeat domain-containing protein [Ignavibacteria bacterium]
MKLKLLFLSYLFIFNCLVIAEVQIIKPTKIYPTSVALFVDEVTFKKIEKSIISYRNSIEADGLSAYVLVSNWKTPEEVKSEIIKLYQSKPKLEGVIFIGEIPIPMIRNAQHLTSAFKLDEDRYPWHRSSVPSDRFYDDFDLKFQYLKQDSVYRLYHYYSLLPTSPQRIHKDIYSARIKASSNNESKYKIIENYLLRINDQKKLKNQLNNMLVFTGHGYNSESLTSWNDESIALREQFPQLYKSDGRLKKLFFGMNRQMKQYTLQQIQEPELDFAIFHAHGDVDLQLLLGYPSPKNTNENIESIKLYLRSKLRSAKEQNRSIEETKKYFMKEFDVPESWFVGAFEDSVIKADSILNYNLDVHIE